MISLRPVPASFPARSAVPEHASGDARAPRPALRECPDCGLLLRLPPHPPRGADVRCPRCDALLLRSRQQPLSTALALTLACLFLYAVTALTPFLSLTLLGRERVSGLGSGARGFAEDGFPYLGALVVLCLLAVPLLRLLLRAAVLLGLRLREPPARLFLLFRWHGRLAPWAMLEVFLFGALVSYTRLVDLAAVEVGPAAYGLGALVLLLSAADATLATGAVWNALEARGCTAAALAGTRAGGSTGPGAPVAPPAAALPPAALAAAPAAAALPGNTAVAPRLVGCHCCHLLAEVPPGVRCSRCGAALHPRKPGSVNRCWALIVAAVILYVPANYYPVMTIVNLGRGGPHTILGGVVEFVHTGFWPLALIVFLASVAVPVLKLAGLAGMLLAIRRGSGARLRARTRLYRAIEAVGRWSMIDVFVVAVLIALVRFGALANVSAQVGAACFAAVVVLTMLAAESFDPRLMWDAAGRGPGGVAPPSTARTRTPRGGKGLSDERR